MESNTPNETYNHLFLKLTRNPIDIDHKTIALFIMEKYGSVYKYVVKNDKWCEFKNNEWIDIDGSILINNIFDELTQELIKQRSYLHNLIEQGYDIERCYVGISDITEILSKLKNHNMKSDVLSEFSRIACEPCLSKKSNQNINTDCSSSKEKYDHLLNELKQLLDSEDKSMTSQFGFEFNVYDPYFVLLRKVDKIYKNNL